jgi:hypothetical protein
VPLEFAEAFGPQRPIGRQPLVDLAQRLDTDAVQPALGIDARFDQTGLAQDAQMLGDGRLADIQVLDELGDGTLAGAQEIENAPSIGFGEDLEGGHYVPSMPYQLYICQCILCRLIVVPAHDARGFAAMPALSQLGSQSGELAVAAPERRQSSI